MRVPRQLQLLLVFTFVYAVLNADAHAMPSSLLTGKPTHPKNHPQTCLDISGGQARDGAAIQVGSCNGSASQLWDAASDGTLRAFGTMCLDVPGGSSVPGTRLQIWECQGGNTNQAWQRVGDTWVSHAGLCIDLPGGDPTPGNTVQIWTCETGNNNQAWPDDGDTGTQPQPQPQPQPTPQPPTNWGIMPTVTDQAGLDQALLDYYQAWKSRYLSHGACGSDRTFVDSSGNAGGDSSITVSEAHGWGMLATAIMAPWDSQAQDTFDGMVRFLNDHPSATGSGLMAWNIERPCNSIPGAQSATDADLDIALALLIADKTWGSGGAINYHALAQAHIQALRTTEVEATHAYLALWENIQPGDPRYGGTRMSDYMFSHLRTFAAATGDTTWSQIIDHGYSIMKTLGQQSGGILPDFAIGADGDARPAYPGFLEGAHDGQYFYNACRIPWRVATDYLVSGDSRGHDVAQALVSAIARSSNFDPGRIVDGYALDGTPFGGNNGMAFVAPVAVGAMVDPANQEFLNGLWNAVVARGIAQDGYYGNTIKLLSMIVLTGHWPKV